MVLRDGRRSGTCWGAGPGAKPSQSQTTSTSYQLHQVVRTLQTLHLSTLHWFHVKISAPWLYLRPQYFIILTYFVLQGQR